MSYEATRNYHYDRDPPRAYVARVAEVFSDYCTAEWLLMGHGPRTAADARSQVEDEGRGNLASRIRREVPDLYNLPYAVTHALLHHLDERSRGGGIAADTSDWPDHAREVWHALEEPIDGRPLDWSAFADYSMAHLHARNLALKIPTTQEEADGTP